VVWKGKGKPDFHSLAGKRPCWIIGDFPLSRVERVTRRMERGGVGHRGGCTKPLKQSGDKKKI